MTTIAYHHGDKQIAYDGQSTTGDMISSNESIKHRKHNKDTYYITGFVESFDDIIKAQQGEAIKVNPEASGFKVSKGQVLRFGFSKDEGGWFYWEQPCQENRAEGSGSRWALAAMDFGKDAREAVKYAASRDIYTGGTIRVFKV